jgi:regulator of protease activity HflC (stomatin/prohibitin superfamily)
LDVVNTQQPTPVANTQPQPPITKVGSGIDKILKVVDMREKCYLIPSQNCTTKDRHDITVVGLAYYEIYDPIKGVVECQGADVDLFIQSEATKLLNDAIEKHTLDQILKQKQQLQDNMKRDGLAKMLRYGTRFTRILIKDIRINKSEHFGKLLLLKHNPRRRDR